MLSSLHYLLVHFRSYFTGSGIGKVPKFHKGTGKQGPGVHPKQGNSSRWPGRSASGLQCIRHNGAPAGQDDRCQRRVDCTGYFETGRAGKMRRGGCRCIGPSSYTCRSFGRVQSEKVGCMTSGYACLLLTHSIPCSNW